MEKDQISNFKKFIKEENPSSQRLNSLRLPRDLTLGGTRNLKKQFTPNLNVTRNKEKAKDALKKNGTSPLINDSKLKKRVNLNRKNGSERFVQSSGIFSDGVGGDTRRSNKWTAKCSDKENDGGSSAMTIPSLKKKNNVDKKVENNVFESLMCQDDVEELDEKVPFQPLNWFNLTTEVKKELKTEGDVTESLNNLSDVQTTMNKLKLYNNQNVSTEYLDLTFDDDSPALSLWKMPDSLCGKGLSDDPNCKELFDYCLTDILEGQIGKLIIRKSGKMEVHIGRIVYQLEVPDLDSYREDIVALDPETEKGSAASILGGIKNRYSLNPNWDTLLK